MRQAIALAVDNVSSGAGGPYGAVIVKDNQVIAQSANQVTALCDPTAHAELMAIRLACQKLNDFRLKDCILYSSCEPCPMCLGAIYWARLQAVYFACDRLTAAAAGFDDSFIYGQIDLPPAARSIKMSRMIVESSCKPFELWAAKTDKRVY